MNNALKHAGANQIIVQLTKSHVKTGITVEDDGKGFDVQHAKNGNGLSNMQNRATQMKGHLLIDSVSGQGTSVTLVF